MLRMEIALFLIVAFIAAMYFSSEKKYTQLHKIFSGLLVAVLIHLVLNAVTVYTVNNLDTVPVLMNDIFHRLFVASMVVIFYLFYQYIAVLLEQETEKIWNLKLPSLFFMYVAILGALILPIEYVETTQGNYSDGMYSMVCYGSVIFYLVQCIGLLIYGFKKIEVKKKYAIGMVLIIEITVCILQGVNHAWLISGIGITLMTLAFYLTLENPDILRAELTEQKMSMLYLKSQVNPHFLYNTLDTIRTQAQLNGDKQVADLLMRLVDFFRRSVKVSKTMVTLDDEIELLESYMELMCARYPSLVCNYDIDPDLIEASVPNFILQPLVENSLLHGLKNKGYRGEITIYAKKIKDGFMEIGIKDTGAGFEKDKKEKIDKVLEEYERFEHDLTGNSIGVLNVQKRIKLLCGKEAGLSYTENMGEGVTAHIVLPYEEI